MSFPDTTFTTGTTITSNWLNAVNDKVQEIISVKDFGAVGDGVTNDTAAIQAALNTGKSVLIPNGTFYFASTISFTANGQCIYGLGNDSVLKSGAGSVYINTNGFDNLTIRDLKIDASLGTNGGIRIITDSQNTLISNVYFLQGNQRVWLWECDNVTVTDCIFDSTGYGVIAQSGYASNNVLITNNFAENLSGDFVEANQASVNSEFWTISNNVFTGSASYPTPATEQRFVGITQVRGVVITGNTVKQVAGDSAIHLEDSLGDTVISNNIFDNCLVSGGNDGMIYLLNSAEDVVISNNFFLRTDAALGSCYGISTGSNFYANTMIVSNNQFVGVAAGGNLGGLNLNFHSADTIVDSNIFKNLNTSIALSATIRVSVTNNRFVSNTNNVFLGRTATSTGGSDWLVSGNVFTNTVGTYDVYTQYNTNGTGAPKRWRVLGNVFSKSVTITGLAGGVVGSASDAEDITISNNVFADGATLTTSGTMSRLVRFNNVFNNATAGGGTTLVQGLVNYANDTAAAAGGIPIGGVYRNGSVVQVRVS